MQHADSPFVLDHEAFERLVVDELDQLPDDMIDGLDNVVFVVEDRPEDGSLDLLGLYRWGGGSWVPAGNGLASRGMTPPPLVPADDSGDEAFADLGDDCREVSGVLSPYVPLGIRLPGAWPVDVTDHRAAVVSRVPDQDTVPPP